MFTTRTASKGVIVVLSAANFLLKVSQQCFKPSDDQGTYGEEILDPELLKK
jgi:hypothetical protein